jgi:hypothetical protein
VDHRSRCDRNAALSPDVRCSLVEVELVPYLQGDVGARLRGHDVVLRIWTFPTAVIPAKAGIHASQPKKVRSKDSCFHVRAVDALSIHGGFNAMQ